MNRNYIIGGGVLLLIILVIGVIFPRPGPSVIERVVKEVTKLGAFPGGDIHSRLSMLEGFSSGGRFATTSGSGTTYTMTQNDLRRTPTIISWNPDVQLTISWSATSTHQYVPKVGDVAYILFRNASTTATDATITFAAIDSGVDIQEVSGGNLTLDGLDWAIITFIREATHLVTIIVQEMQEG